MRDVIRRAILFSLLVLVPGILAPAAHAQQPPPAQPPPAQPPQQLPTTPPATPEAPKVNKEEEDAYKVFFDLKTDDPKTVITSGEDFLKKFPDSHDLEAVYAKLAGAYQNTDQEAKMFAAGEKALELNPDNVDALALMAYTMPRRVKPGDLDADQKLQKAALYANHAIDLLGRMQKPVGLTDEDFAKAKNAELASCHSGLAMVDYYEHDLNKMATELEQATQLSPEPNSVDLFLLGFAYMNTSRPADAVTPLTKCGDAAGPMQDRCKAMLDQAKKMAAASKPATPK
jgi:tetratricopeptide (TPR) repeat protein